MLHITHDGKEVAVVESENEAFVWLIDHQGQSVAYALKYGGWNVLDDEGNKVWK